MKTNVSTPCELPFYNKKILGVIGGLGPEATAYFLQLLTQMSDAQTDQEHMETIIYSKPSIPDRTRFILGQSSLSPVPAMVSAGEVLKAGGAEVLAIPCVTAHYFLKELEEKLGIPILDGMGETAFYLAEEGVCRVGIMATDGTIQGKVIQNELGAQGISCVIPSAENQKKIMYLIYDQVKAGRKADMELLRQAEADLKGQGAEVLLLACTELSLLKRDDFLSAGYLDVLEVLARKAVQTCHHLRKEYERLITS